VKTVPRTGAIRPSELLPRPAPHYLMEGAPEELTRVMIQFFSS